MRGHRQNNQGAICNKLHQGLFFFIIEYDCFFSFLFNRVTKFLLTVTFRGTFSVMLAAGC